MVPRNHAEIGRCPESKGTNAHDPSPHAPSLSLLRVARKCHGPGRALAPLHLPSTPPSVLRDPHQMQMNLKYRVRAPSVFWHPLSLPAARLLKPSPVRRGLQPSQTGTVKEASVHCPSLKRKRISPHHLRHGTAMALLESGVDMAVIALWLGHESI